MSVLPYYQVLQKPVYHPFIQARWAVEGKHLKHSGQCSLGTRTEKHCCVNSFLPISRSVIEVNTICSSLIKCQHNFWQQSKKGTGFGKDYSKLLDSFWAAVLLLVNRGFNFLLCLGFPSCSQWGSKLYCMSSMVLGWSSAGSASSDSWNSSRFLIRDASKSGEGPLKPHLHNLTKDNLCLHFCKHMHTRTCWHQAHA